MTTIDQQFADIVRDAARFQDMTAILEAMFERYNIEFGEARWGAGWIASKRNGDTETYPTFAQALGVAVETLEERLKR